MKARKNLYEELGLDVSASEEDILAAYERLLQHLSSQEHGLTQANADRKIKRLKHAYWILSDQARRAGYDAALASPSEDVQFTVELRETRWTPQKTLLIVIGSLIAFGLAMQIAFTLYAYFRAARAMDDTTSLIEMRSQREIAEDQADAEERRRQAEENRIAAEERRRESERQEAERARERELEENRRYGEQISNNLRRAEEQAQREAETARRRAEQEERARQEAERRRIEQQKYQWRQQLRQY